MSYLNKDYHQTIAEIATYNLLRAGGDDVIAENYRLFNQLGDIDLVSIPYPNTLVFTQVLICTHSAEFRKLKQYKPPLNEERRRVANAVLFMYKEGFKTAKALHQTAIAFIGKRSTKVHFIQHHDCGFWTLSHYRQRKS